MCGNAFWSQTSLLKTGVLKLGMTNFFDVGELIPSPKTMKGMNEPMRARALHTMVINTRMNANTAQDFCTAPESQFCQALRGNNDLTAGQKMLESEQMACRGAGVVQTTWWAMMAVVASMAPMASMVASMSSVASMVPMASMAWMELMAPELKSVRESAMGWRTLVAPHSSFETIRFAFNEFACNRHTEGDRQIQKSQTGGSKW